MKLTTPLLDDWCYLARHLRADEQAQWSALVGAAYCPEAAARGFANTAGPTWCLLGPDDLPVCAGGFEPVRPGVYVAWLAGTADDFARHGLAITRHCRRLMRGLLASGAHRIEIRSLHTRFKASRWYLVGLRMRFEGLHHRAAADGQDLVTYAITGDAP